MSDICLQVDDGYLNLRVGAIILKDNKVLMVYNPNHDWYYSVGGRVKFGETATDAIKREVYEETGYKLEVDHLAYIHEDYFYADFSSKEDKLIYEVCFYFYMKVPSDFKPIDKIRNEGNNESLQWISLDTDKTIYPTFFKKEDLKINNPLKHLVDDER